MKPHVLKSLENFAAGLDVGTLYSRRCITEPRLQTIELELTNPHLNQEMAEFSSPNQNESLIIQRNHSSDISIKIQQTQPTSESSSSKQLAQAKQRSLKQILREVDQLRYRINKLSMSSTILDLTNEAN